MKNGLLPWSEAKNIADLCRFTVQWLCGLRKVHITQSCPPDNETELIKGYLIWLNEHQLFTDNSQPALALNNGNAQRASVSGFCSEIVAKKVASLSISSDLVVFTFPPKSYGGYFIPITIEDYHPFTWNGVNDENNVGSYYELIGEQVYQAMQESWYVIVIDPLWGREKYMWDKLKSVIEDGPFPFDVTPSPALKVEADFVL